MTGLFAGYTCRYDRCMQGVHAGTTGLFAGCDATYVVACNVYMQIWQVHHSKEEADLCDVDNVFVMQRQQDVDLSYGC